MKASRSGSGLRPRFFFDPLHAADGQEPAPGLIIRLDATDSHHAARVLRLRPGDPCEAVSLSDPTRLWKAEVVQVTAPVLLRLAGEPDRVEEDRLRVAVVQALPHPAKIDEVVEKGTEVGTDYFLLVCAAGSPPGAREQAGRRLERWERQAREAAKQSRQMTVPSVKVAESIPAALSRLEEGGWRSTILEPSAGLSFRDWADGVDAKHAGYTPLRLALWVGPEGGWTAEEADLLLRAGCAFVRLGRRILRTETAGPVAAAVLRFALHSW